jgi:hypothetical protein
LTRNYSAEEKLPSGESIRVRAARPDDRAKLLQHLEHLSPASLRSRFFAFKENFTEQLEQLASADFANVVLLLATVPGGGDEQVKGFGAYALREPSSSVAELAITVADTDHHPASEGSITRSGERGACRAWRFARSPLYLSVRAVAPLPGEVLADIEGWRSHNQYKALANLNVMAGTLSAITPIFATIFAPEISLVVASFARQLKTLAWSEIVEREYAANRIPGAN